MAAGEGAPERRTLEEVYALVPKIECKGLCASSCGPVPCEVAEADRLGARYETFQQDGREIAMLTVDRKLRCNMLRNGRCTAYDRRPMICRLWGVAELMPCPWGCKPERVLDNAEARHLLDLARDAV